VRVALEIPGRKAAAKRFETIAQSGPGGRLAVFLIKRITFVPISLFVIATVAFGILYLLPGDPAVAIVGDAGSPDDVKRIHAELGLDNGFWTRYGSYLWAIVHGDLGTSFFTQEKVMTEVGRYLPNTLELIFVAIVVAFVIGVTLGSFAAYFRSRYPDNAARVVITALQSTPDFFLAGVLIYVVFYLGGAAPAPAGRMRIDSLDQAGFLLLGNFFQGNWYDFWDALQHMFLPGVALGVVYASYFAKTSRASMSRALFSHQIEFARACGLRESLVLRYAFSTARTPILTYGAILFGVLVGGEAVVETIFSWQGVGQWALEGSLKLDVPVMQGFILVAGVITLTIYLLLDVVVGMLDPRVSYD
jgi:peptide/nickel transport system permease protein